MTKGRSRLIICLLVAVLLLSAFPFSVMVYADSETTSSSSSNETTRSMITFFQNDRTDLSVDRVARDEIIVYGVFLSNFFVPWSTKLNDMIDNTSEDSIPKQVSKKFFGSDGRSDQIVSLNNKLHEAIVGVLASDKKLFGLYSSQPDSDSGTVSVMTGQDLYDKMAGKIGDSKIYNINGKEIIDLEDSAFHASMQVLFGIAPEMILSGEGGLRSITGLYMDGLGNIWGSYENVDVSEYILVMPASLNPVVFPKSSSGDFRFPVANVFTMGGTLKMSSNFLSDQQPTTPYYNIKSYFPTATTGSALYNTSNMVTIFGIQSPFPFSKGFTDSIWYGASEDDPIGKIESFFDLNSTSEVSSGDANIIISVDPSKAGDATDLIHSENSLSKSQKTSLVNYLFTTTTLSLDQLADDMYYFKVPLAGSESTSGSSEGSWDNDDDLMLKQKMFAKEVEKDTTYQFYSNSYYPSPFNSFLNGFWGASDQDTFLKNRLKNSSKVDTNSAEFIALKNFLNTGKFGTEDDDTINDALSLFKRDNELVFNTVEPSNGIAEISTKKSWLDLFDITIVPTAFGLGENDRVLTIMSLAALKSSITELLSTYDVETKEPFKVSKSGGSLSGVTASNENLIANYFYNAYVYSIFSMNSTFTSQLTGVASGGTFSTPFGDKTFTNKTAIMNDVNNFAGIYWGYMVDLLNIEKVDDEWSNSTFSNEYLPSMTINTLGGGLDLNDVLGASGVVSSESATLEEMQTDIVKKVYGLLSEESNDYRDKLIKSTQDSWIISAHRSITGSWAGDMLSVSSGGNSSYASAVGYISTPSLKDLPLTSWLLDDYLFIYVFLLLVVLIIVVLMVLTNVRTVREGVLIFFLMAFVFILPQSLVTNVINLSNTAGDQIYSDRFNYWAITQHQQSVSNLNSSRLTGDEIDYTIAVNGESSTNTYSTDVGVRVKWMSPKKDDYFDSMFNRNTVSQTLYSNLTIFRWLFNSVANQEEYVYDDPLATYLYRPYNAIAQAAKDSYSSLSDQTVTKNDARNKISPYTTSLDIPDYRFSAMLKDSQIEYSDEQKQWIEEASVYDAGKTGSDKESMESYRYWAFNNLKLAESIFRKDYALDGAGYNGDTQNIYYNSFSLNTESPFYYFYNVFKNRYKDVNGGFKSALLTEDVFKASSSNLDVDGKLRDFLDLEGLFTYVIPYLHQGNEYVTGWTAVNGSSVDSFDFSSGVDEDDPLSEQFIAERDRKEALKGVWKLYTPWVDAIYDLGVYNSKIMVADKSVYIEDSVSPGAYETVGRQMIFSEADMHAKSYRYSDLSDIERRIQATLESTYKDLMYLTNYYDFDDDQVLVSAAAMMATFNFNREFSETKLIGESTTLYPQGFELKNFNYDAFLRLIMLNATGEELMSEKDLYVRILEKTSFFTGILLLICDILAVIVVPAMKVVLLLLLFFLSFVVCLAVVLNPPDRAIKSIIKGVGLPALLFLGANFLFAFVISLFMGEGLTGYVGGRTPSVGISDPTITLLLIIIVDLVYVFVLWKICRMLFKSLRIDFISSAFTVVSLAASFGSKAVKTAGSAVAGAGSYVFNSTVRESGTGWSKKESHKDKTHKRDLLKSLGGSGGYSYSEGQSGGSGSNVGTRHGSVGSTADTYANDMSEELDYLATTRREQDSFVSDTTSLQNEGTKKELLPPRKVRKTDKK